VSAAEEVTTLDTRHVRWRKKRCPHGAVIETAREQSEDGEHWKTLYRFSMVNPPPCPECSAERRAQSAKPGSGL
jgi:hypothetical protein